MNVSFAKAKAGHDKDKIYFIIEEDNEYVYLVDGKTKPLEKPKKKKVKHIQRINKVPEEVAQLLKQDLTNGAVKRAIKTYHKYHERA